MIRHLLVPSPTYRFGKDSDADGFIGSGNFVSHDMPSDFPWNFYLFQWAFAAAAATIVSGSVAERTQFMAYLGYSFFLTSFVYPVVVHWVWSPDGWLSGSAPEEDRLWNTGMLDFAGSGVVHMVGGWAGFMGAAVVGPRVGRFDNEGNVRDLPGHSATLVVLGTFLLWFGWYGFNPGSMLTIQGTAAINVVGRAAVTTTLSGGTAGCTALFLTYFKTDAWDLLAVCNGLLAGLVSVTASCPMIEPWAAVLCGFIGAFIFQGAEKLLLRMRVDDPLAAAPMHGCCGMWGVLFVGLLAKEEFIAETYGRPIGGLEHGLFYGGGGNLLACQVVGIAVIASWTAVLLGSFFVMMNKLGMMRVPPEEELIGLDVSHHGGSAYNMDENDAMRKSQGGL